jgi:hypothetical protein
MKSDYMSIKEQFFKKIEDCDSDSSQTDNIHILSKHSTKVQQFHKILLMGIDHRLHRLYWPRRKNKSAEVTGIFENEISQPEISLKPLPLELSEKIWLLFLQKHQEDLNSKLHDIILIKIEDHFWLEGKLFCNLQKNLLQAMDYMYSHKIIPGDLLRKFLKLQNTMQIVASHRVMDF